ncbi:MAG: CBS domain-containing protein [Pirellulales bacterium]
MDRRKGAWAEDCGATLVEYALLLAIVATVALVGCYSLNRPVTDKFQIVSQRLESNGGNDARRVGRVPAKATGPGSGPGADGTHAEASLAQHSTIPLIVVLIGLVAWYLVKRRAGAVRNRPRPASISMTQIRSRILEKRHELLHLLSKKLLDDHNGQMRVDHFMTHNVELTPPSTPIEESHQLIIKKKYHHLLIGKRNGKLLGIVSDRDFNSREGRVAGDIMTTKLITVTPDTDAITAITYMIQKNISCIPVVEEGKVRGILTRTDLMVALQCLIRITEQLATELDVLEHVREADGDTITSATDHLETADATE